jgi:protein tyrosine phosphatase type 4A
MTNTNGLAGRRHGAPGAPSPIEHKQLKFLIINQPTAATLPSFVEELKQYKACVVVRCCDPTYSTEMLEESNIKVVDFPFEDGAAPPSEVIKEWLSLVDTTAENSPGKFIAVHCVAGLGRAPVLVAVALIESGMKYADAVEFIRQRRRGAINAKQLAFLEKYKPQRKKEGCVLM